VQIITTISHNSNSSKKKSILAVMENITKIKTVWETLKLMMIRIWMWDQTWEMHWLRITSKIAMCFKKNTKTRAIIKITARKTIKSKKN